jgi:hypothetical protein
MLDWAAKGAGCTQPGLCSVAGACAPARKPCEELRRAHEEKLELCRQLEAIPQRANSCWR